MNPILAVARMAVAAIITVTAGTYLVKKLLPGPPDLVQGAIHFRNSFTEFQKGVSSLVFGASQAENAGKNERRDASRIPIE